MAKQKHRTIVLYLPPEKRLLVKQVQLLLKAKNSSLSQLFMECVESFAEAHREELAQLEGLLPQEPVKKED